MRKCVSTCPKLGLSSSPKCRRDQTPTILHSNCVRLFGFVPLDRHPFEEPVHRNNAASRPVSVPERRQGVYGLAFGVDRLSPALWVPCWSLGTIPARETAVAFFDVG